MDKQAANQWASRPNPKSREEIIQEITEVVTGTGSLFDFNEFRLGDFEFRRLLVITPISDASSTIERAAPEVGSISLANGPGKDALFLLIKKEVDHIFKFTRFWNDEVMANSQLHQLLVVQQAHTEFMCQRNLPHTILSPKHKADALRSFLIELFTNTSNETLEKGADDWASSSHEAQNEWITSTILGQQYIERKSRDQIQRYVGDITGCEISGGTYSRHLKKGRQQLATQLWQRESIARCKD